MARYNLNTPETQIITSWLFESQGYLDSAVNDVGVSARQALVTTPSLDILAWIRTNQPSQLIDPDNWVQCAMVWWIRANNGVNININQKPAERLIWIPILNTWAASIDDAFVRVPQVIRDSKTVLITAEDGTIVTRPSGLHLVQQRSMIDKVLLVV